MDKNVNNRVRQNRVRQNFYLNLNGAARRVAREFCACWTKRSGKSEERVRLSHERS